MTSKPLHGSESQNQSSSALGGRLKLHEFAKDPHRALELARSVAERSAHAFGPQDPLTLDALSVAARSVGQAGDWNSSIQALQDILMGRTAVLGTDHSDTLRTRGNIAHATGKLGREADAAESYARLSDDQARVLGATHRDTFESRLNEIRWLGKQSPVAAVEKLYGLIPVLQDVLGPGWTR